MEIEQIRALFVQRELNAAMQRVRKRKPSWVPLIITLVAAAAMVALFR